jgi:hypothetical protein
VQSLLRKCFLGQSKGDLENASSNLDVVMNQGKTKVLEFSGVHHTLTGQIELLRIYQDHNQYWPHIDHVILEI